MSNTHALIRSLVIYSLCLPLAVYLGYSLATPDNYDTLGLVGALLFVMLTPLLLRFHHPLLIATWNAALIVPLVGGRPQLWLALAGISLVISIVNRALRRQQQFLPVLPVALPLFFLAAVVLITGHLTGGIGFRSAGNEMYGGKRYLLLFGAIIGFFALAAQRIPPKNSARFVALFLLSGVTAIIPSLLALAGPPWQYGLVLFSADASGAELVDSGAAFAQIYNMFRSVSLAQVGQAMFSFLLAYYGVREILDLRAWWRLLLSLAFVAVSLFGGFRSSLIQISAIFIVLFCIEGLWRTRFLPALLAGLLLCGIMVLPWAEKLPLTVQRSISFLPIEIDPVARMDAENSSEWRLRIWKYLLPEIPHYLLLGKGFAISPRDIELAQLSAGQPLDSSEIAILAGDYHSGPLSVILPLGIFGVIGFLWFISAGLWALWRNHLYGEERLTRVNAFLLAAFITKIFFFLLIYGSLYSELCVFTGLVGFSISLNGGIRKPPEEISTVEKAPFSVISNLPSRAFGRAASQR